MLRSLTLVIAAALAVLPSVAAAQDTLKWETDLATAQRIAGQTNRLVLVHFWGTWCPPCMEMEKTVFSKPGLGTALHPYYVPVKIQVEDDLNQNLVKQFQVEAFPSDIVMTPEGRIVARSKGFKPADQYVGMLNQMAQQARGQMNPTAPQAVAAGAGQPTAANAGGPAAAASASPYAVAPAAAYAAAGGRYDTQYTPAAPTQTAAAQSRSTPSTAPRGDDRYSYYQPGQPTAPAATPVAAAPVATSPLAANTANAAAAPPTTAGGERYAGYSPPTAPLNGAPGAAAPAAPTPPTTPVSTPAPSAVGDRYAADNRYAPPAATPAPAMPNVAPTNPAPAFSNPTASVAGVAAAAPPTTRPDGALFAGPAAPAAAQVPPGVPPLALDGYCPVTVTEKMVWKKGDVKYGAIHRGHTYLFASAAEQQKFLAAPDVFSPIVSGNDPIAIVEEGKLVPGKREHGCFCDKRMVLFSSAANFEKFKADQNRYVTELQQALQTGKTLRR